MIALLVGTALAVAVLAFVLWPLFDERRHPSSSRLVTPATDAEVEAALAAYRQDVALCPVCGPRPERDAVYCSACGRKLR